MRGRRRREGRSPGRNGRAPGLAAALLAGTAAAALVAGCASSRSGADAGPRPAGAREDTEAGAGEAERRSFQRDREAILSMAGDYDVTFDFRETVPFVEGYEPAERFRAGAHEVVRVIEDTGDTIRLQHLLVVGDEEKRTIKHWRQDWIHEPDRVLTYVGGNAWTRRPVPDAEAEGKWAQVVYQVDDSPRYGALAAWSHRGGVSEWEPPSAWRPLPRRDATERDDYHAVDGVNRHAITPFGWVHEQDNDKLVLTGDEPRVLVREVGLNTYRRSDEVEASVAEAYWRATRAYWVEVRAEWERLLAESDTLGLTIPGEPEPLYDRLLGLADEVRAGGSGTEEAVREAREVIAEYTTDDVGPLRERLAREEEGSGS